MTRMFVTAVPGLGLLVGRELGRLPGIVVRDSGFDGRSDVVLFETTRASRSAIIDLGLAEDLFVEVGRTLRAEGDRSGWIAGRLWRPERVQRALSVWAEEVRPLAGTMTFRVIARVLQERSFLRTDLRRQLTRAIQRDRPRWRVEDPAQIEVWVSEYAQGRFVAGLRLSDERMRQHNGRVAGARGRAPADGGKGLGAACWRTGWRRARPMLRLGNHPSRSARGWLGGTGSRYRS